MILSSVYLFIFTISFVFDLAVDGKDTAAAVRTVYQFPFPTWVENLAIRSTNGKVLVTVMTSPQIFEIDPTKPLPTAKLIYTFPNILAILGIAEIEPDIFVVVGGKYNISKVINGGSLGSGNTPGILFRSTGQRLS